MRILLISSLYPNQHQPLRGLYNSSLAQALRKLGHDVEVIAPVMWCPGVDSLLKRRSLPPSEEMHEGLRVTHPRILYPAGILIHQHYRFYRWGLRRHFSRELSRFSPNHVIAAFAYPDAVAVSGLAETLNVSWSVAVLGSDFRVRITQARFRQLVLDVLRKAPLVFCPGQALRRDMVNEGVSASQITSFCNGVNRQRFHILPDASILELLKRRFCALGTAGTQDANTTSARLVLFVGNLLPVKGVDRLLKAWHILSCRDSGNSVPPLLIIVGEGQERSSLERLTADLGLSESVVFLGALPPSEVAQWMQISHCLCLPSRSEGMPNVALEALACGTPVVATAVDELPGLLADGAGGQLVTSGKPADAGGALPKTNRGGRNMGEEEVVRGLTEALASVLSRTWDRDRVARLVDGMTWEHAGQTVLNAIEKLQAGAGS